MRHMTSRTDPVRSAPVTKSKPIHLDCGATTPSSVNHDILMGLVAKRVTATLRAPDQEYLVLSRIVGEQITKHFLQAQFGFFVLGPDFLEECRPTLRLWRARVEVERYCVCGEERRIMLNQLTCLDVENTITAGHEVFSGALPIIEPKRYVTIWFDQRARTVTKHMHSLRSLGAPIVMRSHSSFEHSHVPFILMAVICPPQAGQSIVAGQLALCLAAVHSKKYSPPLRRLRHRARSRSSCSP
jgi:hypothetical protein